MRRKTKVSTPGSRIRANVLDVLQQEGFIRGYSTTEYGNGRTEFEIDLKYHEGLPVIREISRVSRPGPPCLHSGRCHATHCQWPWHDDHLDSEGRDGRPLCARAECGRRSALQSLLTAAERIPPHVTHR